MLNKSETFIHQELGHFYKWYNEPTTFSKCNKVIRPSTTGYAWIHSDIEITESAIIHLRAHSYVFGLKEKISGLYYNHFRDLTMYRNERMRHYASWKVFHNHVSVQNLPKVLPEILTVRVSEPYEQIKYTGTYKDFLKFAKKQGRVLWEYCK